MKACDLNLDQLVLDPNNYRLQDEYGFRQIPEDRFALDSVQKATLQRLKDEGIKELRDSIVANGFVPIERIVVSPIATGADDQRYLVIEGNRRVAALLQLRNEANGGIDIPSNVQEVFSAVPCLVVESGGQASYFREAIMGIRHVGGIKQWGGFQRAKLIADMHDMHGVELSEVGAKLGLSAREINRRYRAFKALNQMGEDDEFGDLANPLLYPIFHEAISLPEVREWLGWDNTSNRFDNYEQLSLFYALITPPSSEEDGGQNRQAKIRTFSDVRELRSVLHNNEAKRSLMDLSRPLVDALTIANREQLSKKWRQELTEAMTSLNGISAIEVMAFTDEDIAIIEGVRAAAKQILALHEAIPKN